jgi:hypothetical protein
MVWCIWIYRIERIFNNKVFSRHKLSPPIVKTVDSLGGILIYLVDPNCVIGPCSSFLPGPALFGFFLFAMDFPIYFQK